MLCRYVAPEPESEFESAEARKKRRTESAASSSGSSSSSSDGEDAELQGPSGLLMSQLISMNEGHDQDSSKYAAQGKSRERVKTVLKEPCCRKKCKKKLNFRMVFRMICYFWTLSKTSQDCILWSMQNRQGVNFDESSSESGSGSESSESESSQQRRSKISWSMEGQVQKHSFLQIQQQFKPVQTLMPELPGCSQASQSAGWPSSSSWESARPGW
jgi:hypothetical protein